MTIITLKTVEPRLEPRDKWPTTHMIQGYTRNISGLELNGTLCHALIRVQTGHGRCADWFHKWGDCGTPRQTT